MPGTLALVGGEEFTEGCTFDAALVSGAKRVLLVPAARAYEDPSSAIESATKWFESLGVGVEVLEVYRRAQAMDESISAQIADADVVYVTSGSPMHLRSVLKDTPLLDALVAAWNAGTTVALSGEAAAVACSNMVDSRGGAFTVGLDVITNFTVIPRLNTWSPEKWHRTVGLAQAGFPVVGIDEATALIRDSDGTWHSEGAGSVNVYVDGKAVELSALP